MPSLKDTIKDLHGIHRPKGAGELETFDPFYKPLHFAWLGNQQPWSEEALEHARRYFAGDYQHERAGRVSPSSIGEECERAMLFSFGAAPQLPAPEESEDVMESGTFEHLRWQMEGLTHPFLVEAEYWCHSEVLRCGGSVDGVGIDGSLFEFKNTAPHLYKAISRGWDYLMAEKAKTERTGLGSAANYAAGMVRKHLTQMEAYWEVDSRQSEPKLSEFGSLVYQDRASKDVFELRIKSDKGRRREIAAILEGIHEWVDIDELPDMLDGCRKASTPGLKPTTKEQTKYDRCPWREHCPTATTVTFHD